MSPLMIIHVSLGVGNLAAIPTLIRLLPRVDSEMNLQVISLSKLLSTELALAFLDLLMHHE